MKPVFLLLALAICSCGNGGKTSNASGSVKESAKRALKPLTLPKTPLPEAGAPSDIERVFDLSASLSMGHLRSRGLLVDFGTKARHKYTFGDWKSGWSSNFVEGDSTLSILSGPIAHVFFDWNDAVSKETTITMRARGQTRSGVKVYVNGKFQGNLEFPFNELTHGSLKIKDKLVQGQNDILLRCAGSQKYMAQRHGCLAIDYMRIGSADDDTGPAASAFDSIKYADSTGGPYTVALSAGESITFNLPIEEGMRLKGRLKTRQKGSKAAFEITWAFDDGVQKSLFAKSVQDTPIDFDIDLGEKADQVAALTFSATSGEVLLAETSLWAKKKERQRTSKNLKAKNVVLVLIDTLRADKLSLYNDKTNVKAQCLEMLGKESAVFDRAFAPENWTKPSVASLLSGLYPSSHTAKDDSDRVPDSVVMASEHFKNIGFETAAFVANGYVSDKFGFQQGWNSWTNYVREGKANRAKFVVDDSIAWLKNRTKDKPFFLYVHTIDPHVPYIPSKKYLDMYDSEPYFGPVKSTETAQQLAEIKTGKLKLNDRDKIRLEALYNGEISYHDDEFSRFYQALSDEGLLQDTLVIVTSDHGEEFFDHGSVGHGHSLYEELLHVPLIIRLPGEAKGEAQKLSADVSLTDVLPTMCEILGVKCPPGVEGKSLVPILKGTGSTEYPSAAFSEFLEGQRAAGMGRYKVIYRGLGAELYDLKEDPKEKKDVSGERPVALAAMRDALGMHLGLFADTWEGSSAKPTRHKAVKTKIDEETMRQLEALGYLRDK